MNRKCKQPELTPVHGGWRVEITLGIKEKLFDAMVFQGSENYWSERFESWLVERCRM